MPIALGTLQHALKLFDKGLPALRVGRSLFWGEDRVAEAAAAARQQAAAAIPG